jgi:AbrB family looped-hinge helix DNA binding protein
MPLSVKVSTKHQIVVPSEARRALGIEAGDRLAVEVTPEAIILRPRPPRAGARLRGLGREIWQGVDPVEYVRELRREWDERIPR